MKKRFICVTLVSLLAVVMLFTVANAKEPNPEDLMLFSFEDGNNDENQLVQIDYPALGIDVPVRNVSLTTEHADTGIPIHRCPDYIDTAGRFATGGSWTQKRRRHHPTQRRIG